MGYPVRHPPEHDRRARRREVHPARIRQRHDQAAGGLRRVRTRYRDQPDASSSNGNEIHEWPSVGQIDPSALGVAGVLAVLFFKREAGRGIVPAQVHEVGANDASRGEGRPEAHISALQILHVRI